MTIERSVVRHVNRRRAISLAVGAVLCLVAVLSWGQAAGGAPPEGKGDFAGPNPEDMRSFSCVVDDTIGTCVFITNPGEMSHFVVTDLILEGVGSTNDLAVRLSSAAEPDMGVFRVRLDSQGFGGRDLHFESGLVAETAPGSLFISKISGNGSVWVTMSGYYFSGA